MRFVAVLKIYLLIIPLCFGRVVQNPLFNDEHEDYDQLLHPKMKSQPWLDSSITPKERSTKYWLKSSKVFIENQINRKINQNVAKNIIFFIGDGISLTTLAATRLLMGGEEKSLSFEKFPYTGLVRTYCLDRTVPDSASTATSYLTGVKANYGTIGVNGHVRRKDCVTMLNETNHVHSIAKWALDSGKAAGLVTTTRVTHASPAGVYAHTADRDWENDDDVRKDCGRNAKVQDIAHQLIHGEVGKRLKVILGGGRREFRDIRKDPEEGYKGKRKDGRDLIKEWLKVRENGENRTYVYNREQLLNVDALKTDKMLGLFQGTHMLYHLEAEEANLQGEKPTIAEMTKKAIEVMQTHKDGYFLFVEGGKIDLAHHDVLAKLALDEAVELSKAVKIAREMTNAEDTLIVVSSDHSHTMSISGYPDRQNNIFGVAEKSNKDNLPYVTLSYANGRAFHQYYDTKRGVRFDPDKIDRSGIKAEFPSTLPINSETHGGEDVAVFASGPFAHLFTGVYEQNVLPHLMAYAACIGNGQKACDL